MSLQAFETFVCNGLTTKESLLIHGFLPKIAQSLDSIVRLCWVVLFISSVEKLTLFLIGDTYTPYLMGRLPPTHRSQLPVLLPAGKTGTSFLSILLEIVKVYSSILLYILHIFIFKKINSGILCTVVLPYAFPPTPADPEFLRVCSLNSFIQHVSIFTEHYARLKHCSPLLKPGLYILLSAMWLLRLFHRKKWSILLSWLWTWSHHFLWIVGCRPKWQCVSQGRGFKRHHMLPPTS